MQPEEEEELEKQACMTTVLGVPVRQFERIIKYPPEQSVQREGGFKGVDRTWCGVRVGGRSSSRLPDPAPLRRSITYSPVSRSAVLRQKGCAVEELGSHFEMALSLDRRVTGSK